MRRSPIDRRAKRYAPRQCVADVGMHKDAPPRLTSIRCNACHESDCAECRALNAERDARFARIGERT